MIIGQKLRIDMLRKVPRRAKMPMHTSRIPNMTLVRIEYQGRFVVAP
jgi:hypothetical protein